MKQSYTMRIYKTDKRTKSGERIFSTTVWQNRDEAEMKREVRELQYQLYPTTQFRIEFDPAMKTVRNLMTGADIQIAADTPHCCDPSTERYWTM